MTDIEKNHGSTDKAARNAHTQLVDTKMEMVRAAWLSQCRAAVRRFRWLHTGDRLQRNEID